MLFKRKFQIVLLLVIATVYSPAVTADSIRKSLEAVNESYPTRRYLGGGFSVLWGGVSVYRGIDLVSDASVSGTNRGLSYALIALGGARVLDGAIRLLSSTSIERLLESKEEIDPTLGRNLLEASAEHEKRMRWYRAGLSGGTAAIYLALYSSGNERFNSFIWTGLALSVVTVVRIFFRSPEEREWEKYSRGSAGLIPRIEFAATSSSFNSVFVWSF